MATGGSPIVASNGFTRELIFIQAGPAANWVGGHFWNLQEGRLLGLPGKDLSYSCFHPSALFRTSECDSSLRYRPRLVALDTLGSVRSPSLEVEVPPRSGIVAWEGSVQTVKRDDQLAKSKAGPINQT